MSETITIQEALRAIKLTEKKLAANLIATPLVAVQYADRKVVGNTTSKEAFIEQVTATYQSSMDLIARYHLLKGKVAESNATTQITIAGQTMSISAAIEYKTSLVMEKSVLEKLRKESAQAIKELQMAEARLQNEADLAANTLITAAAGTDKKTQPDYLEFVKSFKKTREVSLVDPLDYAKKLEELTNFIDEFDEEIDNLLTLSNVQTKITLD